MYAEAIHQAILTTYLQPLQALIERRAKYYIALNAKDPFVMSDDEAQKWQARIQEIGKEIETLENVRNAIDELHQIYHNRLRQAEDNLRLHRAAFNQVWLDYITFRQMFETESEVTKLLLSNSIQTIQKSRAA